MGKEKLKHLSISKRKRKERISFQKQKAQQLFFKKH